MPSRTTSGQATVSKWMYSQTRRSQPNVPLITALGVVGTAQNPTNSFPDCSPRQPSSQDNGTNLEKLHGATTINIHNSKHEPISVTGTVLCLQSRDQQHEKSWSHLRSTHAKTQLNWRVCWSTKKHQARRKSRGTLTTEMQHTIDSPKPTTTGVRPDQLRQTTPK